MSHTILITGGTGYMGQRLIPRLIERGHQVTAVVRKGSESKLAEQARSCIADPLRMNSYAEHVRPADTFIHLIGVPHPNPTKAAQFRAVDLVSVQVAIKAAREAGIRHFLYLSIAHPAPVMKAYIAVRTQCEEMIRASGIPATFLRPWYVLGPSHRWPVLILPFYFCLSGCHRQESQRNVLVW
jgi:uncharacterized protein YbjT (DUF2867 family)